MTKKEATRIMIINKSKEIFKLRGYTKVTMKDICEATSLSRGGLYSHFSSTKEIFEAILNDITSSDGLNLKKQMDDNISAVVILDNALAVLGEEMSNSTDSLSLPIFEYAQEAGKDFMNPLNKIATEKWMSLIDYGKKRNEFNDVNSFEITNLILYTYQGIRMWSHIIDMNKDTVNSILNNIRKQLVR